MQSSTHKLFVKTSIATAALLAIAYGTAAHSQTVQVTDTGGTSATVYTKDGADTAAQAKANTAKSEAISEAATDATNKVNALATGQVETNRQAIGAEATARANADTAIRQDVAGNTQAIGDDNSGLVRKTTRTRRMVKKINEHLGIGGQRDTKAEPSEAVVLSANRAVTKTGATADETTTSDTITGAAVMLSTDKAAIERADGTEALAATNTETVLKGGTGTTIQTLRDQDKGVAAGTGNSGVNYQTTMYGLNGDNNAEYTTDATAFNTFNTNGTLPADAPAGATGIINEGGVYKYVTNVRLGGVAAGVKDNDAVNKGQLDTTIGAEATARANADTAEATARANADTAIRQDFQAADQRLSQRIDSNTQGIANVTAMASMPALPAGAESGVTAGVGSYNGKNAVAIGLQHRFNANTTFKVAAATGSNGKPAVGTGVSYAWGGPTQAVPGQSQQVVALQDQLRAQATENTELKQRQQAQGETIAAQAAEIAELKRQVSLVLAQQK